MKKTKLPNEVPRQTHKTPETIGLVGVGLLGSALAERFIRAGFQVLGYDVAAARLEWLRTAGGHAARAAGEVARMCPRVVLSLPDSAAVCAVVAEVKAALQPGGCIIDTTTGDPRQSSQIGQELAACRVDFLDAAICGNSEELRRGEVLVVAGGPAAVYARCQDVFATFARQSWHVGDWGAGLKMKLTTNLVLGLHRAVLAEALTFAAAIGLPPELALTVLRASSSYSRVMDLKGRKMIEEDFTPQARLSQHLKDVRLILEVGAESGTLMALTKQHRQLLEAAEKAGWGALDNSAIIQVFRNSRHSEPTGEHGDIAETAASR